MFYVKYSVARTWITVHGVEMLLGRAAVRTSLEQQLVEIRWFRLWTKGQLRQPL